MDTSPGIEVTLARAHGFGRRRLLGGRTVPAVIPSWWGLLLVLILQAVVALTTLRNTVFQDEGLYLYAGRQILRQWAGGPAPLEHYAFYFSGYPDVYPVIGGALDRIGGLELARGFSLVCMLGVTALAYACTRRLFAPPAAIFAAGAYAFLGTVLCVSRLATFDALCLLLIAASAAAACLVSAARLPWMALTVGPLLVLAILAKYAAMLFLPSVLGLLVFGCIAFQGWWRMLSRFALAAGTLALSVAVAYHVMDRLAFHAIAGSTTDRAAIVEKPRLEMLLHLLYMGGVIYVVALLGLVLVFVRLPRLRMMALILFGSSWLTPAYHIYKQEAVSFDKHIAFSLFFAMPLVGCAVAWLAGGMQRAVSEAREHNSLAPSLKVPSGAPYGTAGLAVVMMVVTLGVQQARNVYADWADTSALSTVLHTQMRDGSGRYLAEDIEVARYEAQDITQPWQWNGPYYFYYLTATHQQLLGHPALDQAITDQYFALVELSFVHSPGEASFITERMSASRNYDLIARVPFEGNLVDGGPLGNRYGNGHYYLFRSSLVAGQGTFTSVKQLRMGLP
jgi:hypothetical protein